MKKINLLAVAFAAFTMFSCSNEEIADLGSNAPGEKATLTIKVEGAGNNVAQSRAAGSAGTTTDVGLSGVLQFFQCDGYDNQRYNCCQDGLCNSQYRCTCQRSFC